MPNAYRKVAVAGILYDAVAGNNDCNGKIALTTANDPMPDLKEVLHVDDVAAATIRSTLAPPVNEMTVEEVRNDS
jgi:hypothetical protein